MELENASFFGWMSFKFNEMRAHSNAFYYKLMPAYMPKEVRNLDLRRDKEGYKQMKQHKHPKVKPG